MLLDRRRLLAAFMFVAVAMSGIGVAAPVAAATWNHETLDGAGGANGRTTNTAGTHTAAAVWNGQPHVWYYDSTGGDLRHAWWNGTAWFFETLDGNGGANGRTNNTVGYYNAVAIWNNQPHVWYLELSTFDLRHAWWNGTAWNFETLDGAGGPDGRTADDVGFFSVVTVWNNQPHVWYQDSTAGDFRHAWWNGTAWFFETLDGNGGTNGRTTNIVGFGNAVAIWNNQPHVWSYDLTAGDLRHSWWNGTAWFFETLDGNGGTNGGITGNVGTNSAVAVWNSQPHVWYRDAANGDLRHAWWNGQAWYFEALDGSGGPNGRISADVGFYNAVAVWNGQPHVWHWDYTAGDLRHAWWSGQTWLFETLDGNGGVNGRTTDIVGYANAVTIWNNRPHNWHYNVSNGDLRHSWYG